MGSCEAEVPARYGGDPDGGAAGSSSRVLVVDKRPEPCPILKRDSTFESLTEFSQTGRAMPASLYLTAQESPGQLKEATMSTSPTLLLLPEEVAAILNVSRSRIFAMIASGELESVKIGRSRRVPRAGVETYVDRLRQDQS
jgi:excisionase family DNA binding protein